jgi:phospholipid/cholesterol/gamma-HCH transport system substrate-binding protein
MAATTPRAGGTPIDPIPPPGGLISPPVVVSAPPRGVGRWVAAGALALAVGLLGYLLFSGGGGATYRFEVANDSQLVLGDQVQVGGVPVGSVTAIGLTRGYTAAVITIQLNEGPLVPLHAGTTAQIRVPSLTTAAGRYVALTPGPNNRPALPSGALLPSGSAQGTTDLDQLFDTLNPRTRKGLQQLFVGTAEQYAGASAAAGIDAEYFGPNLAAINHIFAEITRDQPTFTNFLVHAAQALTTLAAHREQLTELVGNGNKTFQAFGAEQKSLEQGVARLGPTIEQGNRAFAQAPSTVAALRRLANVSVPDTKLLAPLLKRLTPLVVAAGPVLHNLALAISRPGPSNDLTDAALTLPVLAKALASGSPNGVKALRESVAPTSFLGPYSPDFVSALRNFGASAGYFDGNGNYARISPLFADFTLGAGNTLTPAATPQKGLEGLKSKQLLRCPGAAATPPPADGSAPFTDNGLLGCDPGQVP